MPLNRPQNRVAACAAVHFSTDFPQALRMKITVRKEGGMWHGYLEGHPAVDERGLTEDVARRKVERFIEKMNERQRGRGPKASH
jgi:hypothetical protein